MHACATLHDDVDADGDDLGALCTVPALVSLAFMTGVVHAMSMMALRGVVALPLSSACPRCAVLACSHDPPI